jgi:hypothetical protein
MPVIFPNLYIRTDLDSELIILSDVYGWARGVRDILTGTYRDGNWAPGKLISHPAALVTTQPGYIAPMAQDIPVAGIVGLAPEYQTWDAIKHTNPDEVEHIPPRFYKKRESGYLFALTDVAIEEPTPNYRPVIAVAFTINTTTDICTAAANGFLSGDKIAIRSVTTLPAPAVATSLYEVITLNANDFLLRDPNGNLVNFTTAGTGGNTAVLVEPVQRIPANEDGVFFVPDAWNPRINTVDPRIEV